MTFQWSTVPLINTLKYLTHGVPFIHLSNNEKPENILVKLLTQCICLNHCSVTKQTQDKLSQLASM